MTTVMNLDTGDVIVYDAPPETAVRLAFVQFYKKDFNTWEYKRYIHKIPIKRGRYSVACHNFAALLGVSHYDNSN